MNSKNDIEYGSNIIFCVFSLKIKNKFPMYSVHIRAIVCKYFPIYEQFRIPAASFPNIGLNNELDDNQTYLLNLYLISRQVHLEWFHD